MKNAGYATGLVGKWHLGYKPEFSPNAHGFDYFFGFLSGAGGLLPAHRPGREARSLRERQAGAGRRLHDRSDHRAVGEVHRAERASAVLPRGRLQRRALAVPGARQAVGRAGQRAVRSAAGSATPARARTTWRSSSAPTRASARSSTTLQTLGLDAQHAGDLHQRQRRRVAVAQRAALPPQGHGVGGRRARAADHAVAGADSGRPHEPQVGIDDGPDDDDARGHGRHGAGRRASSRASICCRCSKGKAPPFERTLFFRNTVGPRARSARCGKATGSCWRDGRTCWCSTCATTWASATIWPRTRQDIARELRPLIAEWEKDVDAR